MLRKSEMREFSLKKISLSFYETLTYTNNEQFRVNVDVILFIHKSNITGKTFEY